MRLANCISVLESIAPLRSQEPWDNSGLLAGEPDMPVTGVLLSLDCTPAVIEEAVQRGANLLICHHPPLFEPAKTLTGNTFTNRALRAIIKENIAVYACHTPLDACPGGVNDTLCRLLGIENLRPFAGFARIGDFSGSFAGLQEKTKQVLCPPFCRGFSDTPQKRLFRVAVCAGAGGDCLPALLEAKPDCFITGELSYHKALELAGAGIALLEAGHYATEHPVLYALKNMLEQQPKENMPPVFVSEINTDPYQKITVKIN